MSSYRDIANPEAIHFPGSFESRIRLSVTALVCVLTLGAIFLLDRGWAIWLEAALVAAVLVLIAVAWPRRIWVDQYGVHQVILPFGRPRFIRHADLEPVRFAPEMAALARLLPFRGGENVEMRSSKGATVVVHTPRHADRDRFLKELERRGARIEHLD